ncbi:RluA family pseudouridine synthase [Vibrio nomapromontoriensis]|uniref:RluA family pseudouridine synthase n=1 Tax=Vibrio nomapromontoriensis TaxID=2910246 RepID=UPI003D12AE59
MIRFAADAIPFTPFLTDISEITPPERFTFPYYYSPHPLALKAISELQHHLEFHSQWQHDFTACGKMFAVLVVSNLDGEIGYLSSVRDEGEEKEVAHDYPTFLVDSIYQSHHYSVEVITLTEKIQALKHEIEARASAPEWLEIQQDLYAKTMQSEQEISTLGRDIHYAKVARKQQRAELEECLGVSVDEDELQRVVNELGAQSSREKRALKSLKKHWETILFDHQALLNKFQLPIESAQNQLDELSQLLLVEKQKCCQFLNQSGKSKSYFELFNQPRLQSGKALEADTHSISDVSGQNLPKLLQAAFQRGLTPLALGEFWWGAAPYDQIRQHKNLYPVCQSKCFEVLQHMLEGLMIDPSPLEQTPSYDKSLEIVYEDDVLVVVNKPAEFLSVSGKYISDSVQARMQARYPHATGPMIVHRLDMSTSGLLVLTLSAEANKHVQKQFIERRVEKRYTALLEGKIQQDAGVITLPLRGDLADRPRQMVCHDHGRVAETAFRVVEVKDNRTKIHLFPKTGRTHQLRVHCAHQAGLNTPIVGDDLYGFKGTRLHLHAGYLKFQHPSTGNTMEFEVTADF